MSSGIELEEEGLKTFVNLKEHKTGDRCIIYKISDDKKKIVIEKTIPIDPNKDQEDEYNEIVASLPKREGRYIVWDLELSNSTKGTKNFKLVFMSWCPDEAPVGSRMVFASSKDAIKKKLQGIGVAIDCSDFDEMRYKDVIERATKAA